MQHHAAAGVATLPSGRRSFPLDGGGGCAGGGGGADLRSSSSSSAHAAWGTTGCPGLGGGSTHAAHRRTEDASDADLYHRLVRHPPPLSQRLDVSIELAQPCRERVTENGVVKEVHVIVKQVPFSIHVRLPPLARIKRECPLGERRCGKERVHPSARDNDAYHHGYHDDDDDHHHHHDHHQQHDYDGVPAVTDLRGLEMEVRLRYDGEGGRAVPFVQRPPLDVIASRVADDGRSAVLTARVRALSSQHQNRLFVAHVRVLATSPAAPAAAAAEATTGHCSPASSTSSLPSSGAPSPAAPSEESTGAGAVLLEALTEPIQVISKPRSSRKRVVRRKRTLGDMLLECTQRIERAQMAHLGAIGALSKRCRLVPRSTDDNDAARPPLAHRRDDDGGGGGGNDPDGRQGQQGSDHQQGRTSGGEKIVRADEMFFLEDPQLMMLMDLPAAFPAHPFPPLPSVGPEPHLQQQQQQQQHYQQQHYQAVPPHSSHYLLHGHDTDQQLVPRYPASPNHHHHQQQLPPPSQCSSACASSSSSSSHHDHDYGHVAAPPAMTCHDAPDPVEQAARVFFRAYAALSPPDRSMSIRRVLRKYGTDRLQGLASLLALLASRPPSPPKRWLNSETASFQSCVCTSCSYETELQNIDGFYKDFINLEFSFQ